MFPSKKQMKKTYLELAKVGFYFALTIACAICAEVILFTQYDENGVIGHVRVRPCLRHTGDSEAQRSACHLYGGTSR